VSALAIGNRSEDQPLVQVRRSNRLGQHGKEPHQVGDPAQIGGTGRAARQMRPKGGTRGRVRLVQQERVDQTLRRRTVKRRGGIDRRHTQLMTAGPGKVARGLGGVSAFRYVRDTGPGRGARLRMR